MYWRSSRNSQLRTIRHLTLQVRHPRYHFTPCCNARFCPPKCHNVVFEPPNCKNTDFVYSMTSSLYSVYSVYFTCTAWSVPDGETVHSVEQAGSMLQQQPAEAIIQVILNNFYIFRYTFVLYRTPLVSRCTVNKQSL